MPSYQAFLSGDNLITFWNNVKWLLFLVAPGVLIWISMDAISQLIEVVKKSLLKHDDDDDNDDYDIYHY
ncbi:MAG: hypothetical protein Q8934_15550 [Bacillota bacterium]|nr:hypothetical protein [Bacillota bacterium]